MPLVLYRKYRPQTFSEFIGQEHVVRTLTNAISSGMISHAYLFSGPRGTGKTTVARLLAKAANCENRKKGAFEPCNQCFSCQEIGSGSSLDLVEIDAASHRGIDDIRELRDGIRFAPAKSKYKVFIIDECLTKDHFISMADGTVKSISEVSDGDQVLSIDMNSGLIVPKTVSNWFKRKTSKTLVIRTPQTTLKSTPSHKLWILRNNEFLLTEAQHIKTGDFLLSPVIIPHVQKNNLTPEQLSLLALVQCDGHVSKDSITIQIEIRKDKDYFIRLFKKGIEAWDIKEKPTITITARGTTLIRIYSKQLKKILSRLNCPSGKKSNKIDVPDAVFQAPLESVKSYLDTYFCCEGDVAVFGPPHNTNYKLNFSSTSESFVKKIQLLLKKFGIGSNLLKIERENPKHSDIYRLSLSGYNLKLFHSDIGVSIKRKSLLLEKHFLKKERQDSIPIETLILQERKENNIPHSQLNSLGIYLGQNKGITRSSVATFMQVSQLPELNKFLEFRYEKIKKIETINQTEEVYDFTVEGTHTFIVNGMCSSNCHQLSKDAANALLKTLEEPPSHAIFILATTEVHKMISTIISRCQRFDFRKLKVEEIIEKLKRIAQAEKVKIDKAALELIALYSSGSIRDGESLLDQIFTFAGTFKREINSEDVKNLLGLVEIELVSQFTELILEKNASQAIVFLNEISDKGLDLQEFTRALINYLRQGLILKLTGVKEGKNPLVIGLTKEELEKLKKQVSKFKINDLEKAINLFLEAQNKMRYSPILQLPLELAIIDCCDII